MVVALATALLAAMCGASACNSMSECAVDVICADGVLTPVEVGQYSPSGSCAAIDCTGLPDACAEGVGARSTTSSEIAWRTAGGGADACEWACKPAGHYLRWSRAHSSGCYMCALANEGMWSPALDNALYPCENAGSGETYEFNEGPTGYSSPDCPVKCYQFDGEYTGNTSSSEQRDGRGVVVAEPIGAGTPSSCKALPLAASTRRAASNDDAAIDALEAGSSFLVLDEIGRMQTHEHDDPAAAAPATTAAALQSVARDYAPARVAGATAWHDRLVRGGSSTELPRAGTGVAPLASDEVGVAAVVLHEPQPPSDILVLNSAYRVLHQMQPPFMSVKPSSSDVSNLRPHAGGDTWP
ncbi:hypothetical protein KFE25_011329 [Diacronema lutheri]|uniref:Uncharacterized protein n=1 Tax=Diacronema lutheri TaxID=2081491 RepID=A0A8J5X1I2_DIALT|nr:hypothetical protein KFE25_011329 [Diacronema lutheri]